MGKKVKEPLDWELLQATVESNWNASLISWWMLGALQTYPPPVDTPVNLENMWAFVKAEVHLKIAEAHTKSGSMEISPYHRDRLVDAGVI